MLCAEEESLMVCRDSIEPVSYSIEPDKMCYEESYATMECLDIKQDIMVCEKSMECAVEYDYDIIEKCAAPESDDDYEIYEGVYIHLLYYWNLTDYPPKSMQ